jgi:hypothetical protein
MWHYLITSVVKNRDHLKSVIGKLISEAYHKNIFPEICRLQGILIVLELETKKLIRDLELSSRPHHHCYAKLALRDLRLLRVRWLRKGLKEVKILKDRFDKIIKKYEPYQ